MSLAQFLVTAKVRAYASGAAAGQLADGSQELVFQAGEYQYRDRYFGANPFAGEEVVWQGGRVIWIMNYYGGVTGEAPAAPEVYAFLQQAMQQVGPDRPFRGPEVWRQGDWEYRDASAGTVSAFTGTEVITCQGREVYRLVYHGGMVAA